MARTGEDLRRIIREVAEGWGNRNRDDMDGR